MNPRILASAIASALLLSAGAASAQTAIQLDRPVSGTLAPTDPKADDRTPYDLYTYRGRPGDRIRVTMSSEAFDAYLAIGTEAAPGCAGDCQINDDGGGGTNSAMSYTIPASGSVQIRANSISENDAGAYTLTVTELPPPAPLRPRPLALNQEGSGNLSASSSRDDGDQPIDVWTVKGRAGQQVSVRVDSSAFDPMVEFGQMTGGSFVSSASDDDSGPGTNARLRATLDGSGNGAVKVIGLGSESAGAYTVTVGDPPAPRPIKVQQATVGESLRGRLDDSDPYTPDEEIRFDVYEVKGRPGQRVEARLESTDFDPILKWGVFEGETFLMDASDDDGGGGTSAKLTVTIDADGAGRLVVTALDASTGGYTLSVVGAARPQ